MDQGPDSGSFMHPYVLPWAQEMLAAELTLQGVSLGQGAGNKVTGGRSDLFFFYLDRW